MLTDAVDDEVINANPALACPCALRAPSASAGRRCADALLLGAVRACGPQRLLVTPPSHHAVAAATERLAIRAATAAARRSASSSSRWPARSSTTARAPRLRRRPM